MTQAIRFSQQELEIISNYFDRIDSGETQKQLRGLHQAFPEWHTVFLLLRKLLAYDVYYSVETDPAVSYQALQKKSRKSDSMRATVHTHFGEFKNLVAIYTAHHIP